VVVAKVERMTVPVTARAIGNVEAIETVAVKARVGGELQRVWFGEGDAVHAGETLFTIDPRPFEAELAQAEALLARDRALLAKAEDDTRRYAGLVEKDFVTREQYAEITANAAALRAAVAAGEAAVANARLNLSFCTITAPVSGRSGTLMVKVGNLIKANDDRPMVTINQTAPIYVSFAVPSLLLPEVMRTNGRRIAVTAHPPGRGGEPATGTLTFVDNAVDPTTETILLKATFPNQEERLWPGQFVEVMVTLGEEVDRVVCPASAVQIGQQGSHVFVVRDDGTVDLRAVTVARADERLAVIDEGLAGGETVVTDGQLRLVSGSAVTIKAGAESEGSPS